MQDLLSSPNEVQLDLSNNIDRKKLVLRLEVDIEAGCRAEFDEDPRTHLGASVIGDDCQAKAWNAFRWLKFEQFDARMLRLFNRGHEEEARFVRWLTVAGWEVREFDPVTTKQFRITGVKGHFGGSLDGLAKAPSHYAMTIGLDPDTVFLIEFKTHSEKSFAKLKKDGVVKAKPQHYRQMCSYGRAYGLKFALYCAVNKNNDELHFEVVPLDWREADDLFRKAESIILSQVRPPKIAMTETFFDCKYCDFAGLCHRNEVPTKNCRSCRHATPVDNAGWYCAIHSPVNGENIPKEVIPVGCPSYARIA
jgi:hypothetical protein